MQQNNFTKPFKIRHLIITSAVLLIPGIEVVSMAVITVWAIIGMGLLFKAMAEGGY